MLEFGRASLEMLIPSEMLAGGELSLEDAYQKMLAPADSSLNMLKFSRNSNSIPHPESFFGTTTTTRTVR